MPGQKKKKPTALPVRVLGQTKHQQDFYSPIAKLPKCPCVIKKRHKAILSPRKRGSAFAWVNAKAQAMAQSTKSAQMKSKKYKLERRNKLARRNQLYKTLADRLSVGIGKKALSKCIK